MSSADYFAGRDPALDYARTTIDLRSVPQIVVASGTDAALAESQRRLARFGMVAGWHAFAEDAMNSAGYALLRGGKPQEQMEATSKDGTKIPYFIVHREGMKRDGNNPTLLYAYGGFESAQRPRTAPT